MKLIIALTAALIATQASAASMLVSGVFGNPDGETRAFAEIVPLDDHPNFGPDMEVVFGCDHFFRQGIENRRDAGNWTWIIDADCTAAPEIE